MSIYKKAAEIIKEDLPILYVFGSMAGVAFQDYVKGYRKGFTVRFSWHGGGLKYLWLDK